MRDFKLVVLMLVGLLLGGLTRSMWKEYQRLLRVEANCEAMFQPRVVPKKTPPTPIYIAMSTKTTVVHNGKLESAQILPGDRGKVLVRWTGKDGEVVEQEGDTVMEAADRVSLKLSRA